MLQVNMTENIREQFCTAGKMMPFENSKITN